MHILGGLTANINQLTSSELNQFNTLLSRLKYEYDILKRDFRAKSADLDMVIVNNYLLYNLIKLTYFNIYNNTIKIIQKKIALIEKLDNIDTYKENSVLIQHLVVYYA